MELMGFYPSPWFVDFNIVCSRKLHYLDVLLVANVTTTTTTAKQQFLIILFQFLALTIKYIYIYKASHSLETSRQNTFAYTRHCQLPLEVK